MEGWRVIFVQSLLQLLINKKHKRNCEIRISIVCVNCQPNFQSILQWHYLNVHFIDGFSTDSRADSLAETTFIIRKSFVCVIKVIRAEVWRIFNYTFSHIDFIYKSLPQKALKVTRCEYYAASEACFFFGMKNPLIKIDVKKAWWNIFLKLRKALVSLL